MRVEWVVRYEDGSEVTNLDADPWEIRAHGVMAVMQRDPIVDVTVLRSGPGVWAWKHDQWVAFQSEWSIWDYLWHWHGPKIVLTGEMLPDPLWRDRQAMYEDTERLFGKGKTLFKAGAREDELVEDLG